MDKKEKIKKSIPSYFKPTTNVMWKTLLNAYGTEDNNIVTQISETKKQIFVDTAEKEYLDALGDNVAVFRPLELNLSDEKYRELIKFLSFYPKQVKHLIYKILDVFYAETFARFNLQTQVNGPFALFGEETLVFKNENGYTTTITKKLLVDGETDGPGTIRISNTSGMYLGQTAQISDDNSQTEIVTVIGLTNTVATLSTSTNIYTTSQNAIVFFDTCQYVTFKATDFETPGSATVDETVLAINERAVGVSAESISADTKVNLRTNTPGLKGSIVVLGGTANDVLQFSLLPGRVLRIEINEIKPNEVVIRIPSTIPALRRQLEGCLHFHLDSTLTSGWPSSYLYNPTLIDYTVNKTQTTLNQNITEGLIYTQLSVTDSSSFPNESGILMIGFGRNGMEYPISYIGRPNNSTLLIDPSYQFTKNHLSGESINIILNDGTTPRGNGEDYPVYAVGIEAARTQVQDIITGIVAEGVLIRWVIDYPRCGIS